MALLTMAITALRRNNNATVLTKTKTLLTNNDWPAQYPCRQWYARVDQEARTTNELLVVQGRDLRAQRCVEYKARERGIRVTYVPGRDAFVERKE